LDEGLSKAYERFSRRRSKNWQLGLPGGHAKCGLVAVMDIQDHGIMGAERGGRIGGCSEPTKIMGDHGGKLPTTW